MVLMVAVEFGKRHRTVVVPKDDCAPLKGDQAVVPKSALWPYALMKGLPMNIPPDVAGTAALAICESLLLALNDHNILPEVEILGILQDAAGAHANDPGEDGYADLHKAVAALINGILASGNSVRRR